MKQNQQVVRLQAPMYLGECRIYFHLGARHDGNAFPTIRLLIKLNFDLEAPQGLPF